MQVDIEFWARDAGKAVERGDLIVVIDVLRSGTSILRALTNGAKSVIPIVSLKEAHRLRSQFSEYLLAGERRGYRPKCFDFGNSPLEFTRERVNGKNLVMTTSSGIVAVIASQAAKRVMIGAFLNAAAVASMAEKLATEEGLGVSLVLAGNKGRFSLEDFLCAGAIGDELIARSVCFSDKVQAALLAFKQTESDLKAGVMESEHAKHLAELGFREDIDFSCQLNLLNAVPFLDHGRITLQAP